MDSDKLHQEEATTEEAPRLPTSSNGELGFHHNSADLKSNGNLEEPIGSPSTAPEKPVDSGKGKGLRKWRRIKREFFKEGSTEFTKEESPPDLSDLAQLAQMHKRRIPLPDSSRNAPAGDERDNAEGESSVASIESRNTGLNEVSDYGSLFVPSKSPEVEQPLMINGPPLFSIGAVDSDNSEDRSSKSSTAASAPKGRYDHIGTGRDRSRSKSMSMFSTSQRGSRAKGETGRSHRLRAEAENSNSNSNAVSNGKHSEKSVNYDGGDNSDEGLQGEEVRSSYYRENGSMENPGQVDSGTAFEKKNDVNNGSEIPTLDPFVESIMFLKTTQEALETEIEKLVEIEKETTRECEEAELSESPDSAIEINELNQKINSLESRLEAALTALREKDLEIVNLKSHLNQKQMQPELDQLIQEKLEADINSLVISKTTQKWRRVAEDQNALYNETKSLSSDHKKLTIKLRETEKMEAVLKEQVEELKTVWKEKSCIIEVLKLKNLTYDTSLAFFMESLLVVIMTVMFIRHLLPNSSDIVPT